MIKYEDLVEYTKRNHIRWSTDLFDVLRGFFEEYLQQSPLPSPTPPNEELIFEHKEFKEPDSVEYTTEDILNLFST
jgi:hypothetical protein